MVDTRKLKDDAAEFIRKGKFEKAAKAFEELVKADPRDVNYRLKLGDAWRRADNKAKAIDAYRSAADAFARDNQVIKAIAACKLILEIDPQHHDAQAALADLVAQRYARPGAAAQPASRGGPSARSIAPPTAGGTPTSIDLPDDDELEIETPQKEKERVDRETGRVPTVAAPAKGRAPPTEGGRSQRIDSIDLPEEGPGLQQNYQRKGEPPTRGAARAKGAMLDDSLELDDDAGAPPAELEPEEILEGEPAEDRSAIAARVKKEVEGPIDLGFELGSTDDAPPAPPPRAQAPPPALAKPAPKAAAPIAPPPPAPTMDDGDDGLNLDDAFAETAAAAPVEEEDDGIALADMLAGPSGDEEEVELLTVSTTGPIAPVAAPAAGAPPPAIDIDKARVPLFGDLSREAFIQLTTRLRFVRAAPGDVLIREGEAGRTFCIVVSGKVKVVKKAPDGSELKLAELGDGTFFGEMAVLSQAPRLASVIAVEDTELLEISDTILKELVRDHPNVAGVLKKFYRQRLLSNVMSMSALFKSFDRGERKMLIEKFKLREFAENETAIVEGQKSDGLYVVMHGAVRVEKNVNGAPTLLATLHEGDIFGEMSLLTRQPASATCVAARRTLVLRLAKPDFDELKFTHPQILEFVSELSDQRKGNNEKMLAGAHDGEGLSIV